MVMPDFTEIAETPQEKLSEFCSKCLYSVDGVWFSLVEQKYGLDAALELDIKAWERLGGIIARRALKTFEITGDNIHTLIKAFELDPMMSIYEPTLFGMRGDRHVVRFAKCPPQEARIRDGRGEFPCKPVGIALLESYTRVVNPNAKVQCSICPPDPHPSDFWCEWEFAI